MRTVRRLARCGRGGDPRRSRGVNPQIALSSTRMQLAGPRTLLPERLMATLTGFFGVLAGLIAASASTA